MRTDSVPSGKTTQSVGAPVAVPRVAPAMSPGAVLAQAVGVAITAARQQRAKRAANTYRRLYSKHRRDEAAQ
jgi:hypothetical protein